MENWDEVGEVVSSEEWDKLGEVVQESWDEVSEVVPLEEEIPTDPIELTNYIMERGLNDEMDREEVLQKISQFPKLSRSELMKDPWYKKIGYALGDVGSFPGRLIMSSFEDDGMLETMGKPSKTLTEKIIESPAGPVAAATAALVGPAALPLAGIGAGAALADEAYQADDANVLDYMVAGTIGAASPTVGKYVLKLASGLLKGVGKTFRIDEAFDVIKKTLGREGVKPNYADEVLKAHGKEITETLKKTGMYVPKKEVSETSFKEGTKKAIDKAIDFDYFKLRERIVDVLGPKPSLPAQEKITLQIVKGELEKIAKDAGVTLSKLNEMYPTLKRDFYQRLMRGVNDFYEGVPIREFATKGAPSVAKSITGQALKPDIQKNTTEREKMDSKGLGALMIGPGRF